MKGIILAGGSGSRLDPITRVASKQLQPVYDKPMIYYPLSTLMLAGITDILVISTPDALPRFEALLGDGSQLGITLRYEVQVRPEGIAQAFIIGAEFIANESVALILGDNIFYGDFGLTEIVDSFISGATILAYPVIDPERYGVVELNGDSVISLEEKPSVPRSNLAVPGFYMYDQKVSGFAKRLEASPRGELEITDLNLMYMQLGELRAEQLGRGIAWLDSGTHASLLEAANFIATIERRQGLKIGCLEEVALNCGYISRERLKDLIAVMPNSEYRDYVVRILSERGSHR